MSSFKLGNFSKDTTTICDKEYYLLGGVCTICPEEYYCDGAIKTKCGGNYYCPVGTGTSTDSLGGILCPVNSSVSYTNNVGCIKHASCGTYSAAPEGKILKLPHGTCAGILCTAADEVACFEERALCSSYATKLDPPDANIYVPKDNNWASDTNRCLGATCAAGPSDIAKCFDGRALCSSYATTVGANSMPDAEIYVAKDNNWASDTNRCLGATCATSDRDNCFDERALCSEYATSLGEGGHELGTPANMVVKGGTNYRCVGATCNAAADEVACFDPRALCSEGWNAPPTDFVDKGGANNRCLGATCTTTGNIDRDNCFDERALCSSYATPLGAGLDEPLNMALRDGTNDRCLGAKCTTTGNIDRDNCFVCARGYELDNGVCTQVSQGTYKNVKGNGSGVHCPNGYWTASAGATDLSDCKDPNDPVDPPPLPTLPTNWPDWENYNKDTNNLVCFSGYKDSTAGTALECGNQIQVVKALNPNMAIFGTFLGVNKNCRWGMGADMAAAQTNCIATNASTDPAWNVGAWQVKSLLVY